MRSFNFGNMAAKIMECAASLVMQSAQDASKAANCTVYNPPLADFLSGGLDFYKHFRWMIG
jgi:hypothetical protein